MRHKPTTPVTLMCQTCSYEFAAYQSDIRKGRKSCSRACYVASISKPRQPLSDRFWDKVDRSGGPDACWPWTAYCVDGYGRFNAIINGQYRQLAHVVAYVLTYGELPADKPCALHRCDNRPCCNPSHLFPGTTEDNNADRHQKGRSNSPQGEASPNAKLTADHVREIRAARAKGVRLATLAAQYGVGLNTISEIAHGTRWRTV